MLPRAAVYVLGVLCLAMFVASQAEAEPYMAVREGYSCGTCHINHTGGGMRNAFGATYSQMALPAYQWPKGEGDDVSRFARAGLSQSVSVGANLRVNNTTIFAADSTFNDNTIGHIDTQNAFSIPEGNLYLKLDVLPEHISLYIDTTVAPFFGAREAFVLADGLPGGMYVKAGQLLQPYGVRLLDDDTSTRTVTQYRYDTSQLGVEVGLDAQPQVISLAITDNGGAGIGKKAIGSASVVMRRWRIGLSGAISDESTEEQNASKRTYGAWGGFNIGRLSMLGEIDVVQDTGTEIDQLVSFIEGDFLVARGTNLKVAVDFHDRQLGVTEDYRSRLVTGIEFFPAQFLQMGLYHHLRMDIPQAAAADRADRLVFQLHGFL